MERMRFFRSGLAVLLLFFAFSSSASASPSTLISGAVFEPSASTGRSLLQAKKSCPVNFEFMNYTIITSQCKGPKFPKDACCGAFKEFACPYVDMINDLSSDCASTMFSYINLYGKYPPGIFSSECKEGTKGLECIVPTAAESDSSGGEITSYASARKLLIAGIFLILLFQLL